MGIENYGGPLTLSVLEQAEEIADAVRGQARLEVDPYQALAELAGVSRDTVRRWEKRGQLALEAKGSGRRSRDPDAHLFAGCARVIDKIRASGAAQLTTRLANIVTDKTTKDADAIAAAKTLLPRVDPGEWGPGRDQLDVTVHQAQSAIAELSPAVFAKFQHPDYRAELAEFERLDEEIRRLQADIEARRAEVVELVDRVRGD